MRTLRHANTLVATLTFTLAYLTAQASLAGPACKELLVLELTKLRNEVAMLIDPVDVPCVTEYLRSKQVVQYYKCLLILHAMIERTAGATTAPVRAPLPVLMVRCVAVCAHRVDGVPLTVTTGRWG